VEDNPVNQKVIVKLLEKRGHVVSVAGNGHEALAMVHHQLLDLVLMDVQMPEMDGLDATHNIRKLVNIRQPRIIAMTANAMQGDREECLAAGMDDYISKPVQVKELQAALERWGQQLRPIEPAVPVEPVAEMDWSKLNDLRALQAEGEADFALEMVNLYLDNVPQLITAIRQAIARGDASGLQRSAHTLKALRLATLCADLEKLGHDGAVEGGETQLTAAELEFNRVRVAFQTQFGTA
jgi:CheY-like chemotaxis protein